MKRELFDQWIKALEDVDTYPHGTGSMKTLTAERRREDRPVVERTCYCALGVLADVIIKNRPEDLLKPDESFDWQRQPVLPTYRDTTWRLELRACLHNEHPDGQTSFIAILPRELARRLEVSMNTFDAIMSLNDTRGREAVIIALKKVKAEGFSLPSIQRIADLRRLINETKGDHGN